MSDVPAPVPDEDPLLKSARREALVCLFVWLVATGYSVLYCWMYGTDRSLDSLTFVLGFPDWIFWGVIVPWGACTIFSAWFCMFYITDEDLGMEPESSVSEGSTLVNES